MSKGTAQPKLSLTLNFSSRLPQSIYSVRNNWANRSKYVGVSRSALTKLVLGTILLLCSLQARADGWSNEFVITSIEPLMTWQGGLIRIRSDISDNPASCSNSDTYEFLFTAANDEIRSVTISAIYTAFAANKTVKLYIDGTNCSPVNTPIILGVHLDQ